MTFCRVDYIASRVQVSSYSGGLQNVCCYFMSRNVRGLVLVRLDLGGGV